MTDTSRPHEHPIPANTSQALKRLSHCNQEVLKVYLKSNNRLSNPAKQVLKCFLAQYQYEPLIKAYYEAKDWEAWESEELRKVVSCH